MSNVVKEIQRMWDVKQEWYQ